MVKQIQCGQMVTSKVGKINGMITAKLSRFKDTQYEVTFVVGTEHNTIWLHRQEFEPINENKIGFK
jgi:hypothetical protein